MRTLLERYKLRCAIRHVRKLDRLRNVAIGMRSFVVANGPSLSNLPLGRLQGEFLIGVNRSYLASALELPKLDLLVVSDPLTYKAYRDEIEDAGTGTRLYREDVFKLFLSHGGSQNSPIPVPFQNEPCMDQGYFATDLCHGLYRGFSVVLDAIQIAYFMGFSEVYLLGCDLDYDGVETHFYGTGDYERSRRTDMPIHRVRASMRVAKTVFEDSGRFLCNATDGGTLEEIGRVSLAELLG